MSLSIAGLEPLWGDEPLLIVFLLGATCIFACYSCAEIAVKMAGTSSALHVMSHSVIYYFSSQTAVKEAINAATPLSDLGVHTQHFPGYGTLTANKKDARGRKL